MGARNLGLLSDGTALLYGLTALLDFAIHGADKFRFLDSHPGKPGT
jgi:hypothetical protein